MNLFQIRLDGDLDSANIAAATFNAILAAQGAVTFTASNDLNSMKVTTNKPVTVENNSLLVQQTGAASPSIFHRVLVSIAF